MDKSIKNEGTLNESKFTRTEAATYLKISLVSIDRAIANRKIACYRLGRRVIFGKHHLDDFLSKSEVKAKTARGNFAHVR